MHKLRGLIAVFLAAAAAPMIGGPVSAQIADPNQADELVAKAVAESYEDGPNGTVVTLTELETLDGRSVTVQTHGGITSEGIGQYTSHEPHFTVGASYRMELIELTGAADSPKGTLDDGPDAVPGVRYRVLGGDDGLTRVTDAGVTIVTSNATPDNFTLQPYSWAWRLPDDPPEFSVNPNLGDISNEVALVRAGFDTWENDDGSSMDWTYAGTTSVDIEANDATNAVFWADTPDPADEFLAKSTTFYFPLTGQAISTDILFNNDYRWADGAAPGSFDLVSVAIHESGHSLGLGHAPNDQAIMFSSFAPNSTKRVLSLGDRGGVAALYPRAATGSTVSGRVTFSDGAAAAGVKLNLFTENRAAFLGAAFTDGSGGYDLELPSAGCYVITFIAPQGGTFVSTGSGFRNRSFCVAGGQTANGIDAVLVAVGAAATSSGRVAFVGGSAAEGVKLNLYTENRTRFIGATFTDAQGEYSFDLEGDGCYVTTFIAPDGVTFAATGGRFLNRAFCAERGEAVTGIDGTLVAPGTSATLGDRVTNADGGSGQAGVKIVLYRANPDGSRGQWLGPTLTDANGFYSFDPGPGCYVLDFIAPVGRLWVGSTRRFQRLTTCVGPGETDLTLDGVLY